MLCDNVVDHAEKSAQRAGCSRGLPLRIIERSDTIAETMRAGRALPARHAGDRLKRWFFKNARWEAIAVREG